MPPEIDITEVERLIEPYGMVVTMDWSRRSRWPFPRAKVVIYILPAGEACLWTPAQLRTHLWVRSEHVITALEAVGYHMIEHPRLEMDGRASWYGGTAWPALEQTRAQLTLEIAKETVS